MMKQVAFYSIKLVLLFKLRQLFKMLLNQDYPKLNGVINLIVLKESRHPVEPVLKIVRASALIQQSRCAVTERKGQEKGGEMRVG